MAVQAEIIIPESYSEQNTIISPLVFVAIVQIINPSIIKFSPGGIPGTRFNRQLITKQKTATMVGQRKTRQLLPNDKEQQIISKQKSFIYNEIDKSF